MGGGRATTNVVGVYTFNVGVESTGVGEAK